MDKKHLRRKLKKNIFLLVAFVYYCLPVSSFALVQLEDIKKTLTKNINEKQGELNQGELKQGELITEKEDAINTKYNIGSKKVTYKDKIIIFEDDVTLESEKFILIADKIIYDTEIELIHAVGNIVLKDRDNNKVNASEIFADKDFTKINAKNVIYETKNNEHIVASELIQENNETLIINGKITFCDICDKENKKKKPTWYIQGSTIKHNKEKSLIEVYNALVKVGEVPVMLLAYTQFSDPTVKRRSGFLTPSIYNSSKIGTSVEVPYYFALSPYHDLTISPRFFSNDILLGINYRQNFFDGFTDLNLSLKSDKKTNLNDRQRWHIDFKGKNKFNDLLTIEYDINRASDKTYLYQYDILSSGSDWTYNRFINQLNSNIAINFGDYLSFNLSANQDLRISKDTTYQPELIPWVKFDYYKDYLGGVLSFIGHYNDYKTNNGYDFSNMYFGVDWKKNYVFDNGLLLRNNIRSFYNDFSITDINKGNQNCLENYAECLFNLQDYNGNNYQANGFNGEASFNLSYPLLRNFENYSWTISPQIMPIISFGDNFYRPNLFAENIGVPIQFNNFFLQDSNLLFSENNNVNKLNIALQNKVEMKNGRVFDFAIARQFYDKEIAISPLTQLFDSNGQKKDKSDYLLKFGFENGKNIKFDSFSRINDELEIQDHVSNASFNSPKYGFQFQYKESNYPLNNNIIKNKELTNNLYYNINDNWRLSLWQNFDIDQDKLISRNIALKYSDECSLFEFGIRSDNTSLVTTLNESTLYFRYQLKNFKNSQ